MVTKDENDLQSQAPSADKLSSDIEDLYIGHIDELVGFTNGAIKTRFAGEVLLHGQAGDDAFKITYFQRLALYGVPDPNREGPDDLGVISLIGPSTNTDLTEKDGKVFVDNLRLHLHYRALSRMRPRSRTKDSVAPQAETIAAGLAFTWEKDGKPGEPEVRLKVELHIAELIEKQLGIVQEIAFEPFTLVFRKAGSGAGGETSQHNSLSSCRNTSQPCQNPAPYNQVSRPIRQLPLKFINVSSRSVAAVEGDCQAQINCACEVWRHKAALRLNVEPHIDNAVTLKGKYQVVNTELQATLPCDYAHFLHPPANPTNPADPCYDPPTDPYPNYVEIYLVDTLTGYTGEDSGGCSYNDGMALAYCILQVNQLATTPYLLAHELGHVLGLTHPWIDISPGSWGSIMEPHIPSFTQNTRQNCQIFGYRFPDINSPCLVLLNPLCLATLDADRFCLES